VIRFAALALALGGCSLLVSVDGLTGGTRDGGTMDQTTPGVEAGADVAMCTPSNTDNLNCGRCGHSCLGASCAAGKCEPIRLATNQAHPLGIFVAPDGSRNDKYVFWVNQMPPASLRRADKADGMHALSLDSPGDLGMDPYDLVADDNNVYWTEFSSSQVYMKGILSGSKAVLWSPGGKAGFMSIEGGFIYATGLQGATGIITNNKQAIYSGNYTVSGLSAHNGVIYWIEQELKTIVAGDPQGMKPPATWVTPTGPNPMGLAVDDDYFYWTEDGVRLQRRARGGGNTETLYTASQPFGDSDLAVDSVSVFWTDSQNGQVMRMAKP
jgi:hypothetical protein